MANIDFDQLNRRLRKRLDQLRQHKDPAERLRILKRYLSHFVKLVQTGHHFETSFGEHLRLVVIYLNDRREQPLEEETLGTIVKTLCVICCITNVSHQTVMIALHGLLDIFERISCKETLAAIEYCGNHFKKLIVQFKRFGYYKIERLLVELIYITSLAFNKSKDRKNYVLELGRLIGGSWEKLLAWKSIAVEKEVRIFINEMQDRYPMFAAYSVPVEGCLIGEYRLEQPKDSNGLWMDINFKPATVRFAGCCVVQARGGTKRLDMNVELEINHRNVSKIDWKIDNDKHLLSIEYQRITFQPDVLNIEQKGTITFTVSPSFDWDYLVKEVITEVRLKADRDDDSAVQPNITNIEGLLNVSLLESVVSGPANSHNFDQSPRLRENRDAIEQHRNMRCQMLDTPSSAGSNKENLEPNRSVSDVRVVLQDVQRLRVFQSLQQDCQQRRSSRASKQNSPPKRSVEESVDLQSNEGKKRKLFDKQTVPDVLNESVDSQIQRNKYVEKKLVNTVKPIQTLDVKPLAATDNIQNAPDVLNESSATDMMSTEELEQSLQAYIDNNGIFGINQQKVLDKKLEKNIRKINQMVERSTKRFFKRESTADNPYEFIDSEGNKKSTKKQANRKGTNSSRKRKPKTTNENTSAKAAKNAANQSLRNKNSKNATKDDVKTPTKPAESIPPRTSLPRSKKPTLIVDLSSDSETEAVEIGNTFQNLDISTIASEAKSKHPLPFAKRLFAKSTPIDGARSKKRPLDETYPLSGKTERQEADRTFSVKKQRVPLLEVDPECNNGVFIRRDYKKQHLPEALQQKVTDLIGEEKDRASSSAASFSDSHSDDTRVTVDIPQAHVEAPTKTSLTKAMVLQHQTSMSDASIPQSLVVNPSPPTNTTVPAQKKPKLSAEPTQSNFNMNYAKNRYTLKKFISDNDQTFVAGEENLPHLDNNTANDGNDTILSDEIRVGRDAAAPPSFRDDDSSDLQFAGNITMDQASPTRHYPTTPQPERYQKNTQDAQAPNNLKEDPSDANLSQTVTFNGAANQTKAGENTMPSSATNASAALQTLMIEQFLSRIHQELDPSLTEFETKVQKLNKMMTDFEPHLLEHDIAEFNRKCEEILEVEDKLDQLFSELTKLCMDTLDRSDKATVTAKKLARYAETKVVFFKEQNQMARQEIPGIVDEYVKSVWNEQVQLRLNQVQLLMTKMLM